MSLDIYDDIYDAFYTNFMDVVTPTSLRAVVVGKRLGTGIFNGFSKLLVALDVGGVMGSSAYSNKEPPFNPIFKTAGLISTLQDEYKEIYKGGSGNLSTFCTKESITLSKGIHAFFAEAIFPLELHEGVMTAITPPYTKLQASLYPKLMTIYTMYSTQPSVEVLSDKVTTALQSSTDEWVKEITFTGNIFSPCSPGTATGVFL